jgi:hypothetical protein
MMGYGDKYGWNVKMQRVTDHAMLTRTLKNSAVRNLLLFCEYQEHAMDVVRLAIEEDMMKDSYHWLLGNVNMPLTWDDVDRIRRGGAYITRLQMVTKKNVAFDYTTLKAEPMDEWPYRLRLTYDAVVVFSQAVQRLKNSGTARFPLERVVCHSPDSYEVSPLDAAIKAVSHSRLKLTPVYSASQPNISSLRCVKSFINEERDLGPRLSVQQPFLPQYHG